MRLGFKILVLLVILGVLAAGLLPPLFDQGHLRDDANSAAQAGAAALLTPGAQSVNQAVEESIATHHGLQLASMKVNAGVVTVVVKEKVHTFMSGTPGFKSWFELTVTQSASAFGSAE